MKWAVAQFIGKGGMLGMGTKTGATVARTRVSRGEVEHGGCGWARLRVRASRDGME